MADRWKTLRVLTPEAAENRGVIVAQGGPWRPAPAAQVDPLLLVNLRCGACGKVIARDVPLNVRLANAAIRCWSCGAVNDADPIN